MLPTPVQIPPERVPPIAKEVASSKQTWAILFWFTAALAGLIAYGQQSSDSDHVANAAGVGFWAIVLFAIGLKHFKVARRAERAVKRAEDPHVTWTLAGRELVAYTDRGISIPESSFKLSQSQVTMLTALPSARLRP